MIEIFLNNERLDMSDTVVTFKKSQQLNGIQNQYSFSNNFELPPTSKNKRLLNISYLPNSKAKSMTAGYSVDVVLNGCMYLKSQKLKVQKQTGKNLPIYILFSDSLLSTRLKDFPINDVNTGVLYAKILASFTARNTANNVFSRTGYVSAQYQSQIVSINEVPILYNLVGFIKKLITQLGYSCYGDFFEDTELAKYYFSPNVGIYESDSIQRKPVIDSNVNGQDFLTDVLKTFNAFADISDANKNVGVFLWKNIDAMKANFVDYSDKFVDFEEYTFSGGLAKKNLMEYASSQPFFNSFFENNKSSVDQATYLKSDFGAGNMALFSDQETATARVNLETGDPQVFRLYKFETVAKSRVLYLNGSPVTRSVFAAVSPNILDIWQHFHAAYCRNVSLPTISVLTFRYDAILLNGFKMQNIFYTKQLSTYWLPLELNFSTKKDVVKVKALMIEKTKVDVPEIYDTTVSVNFGETLTVPNAAILYNPKNISPLSDFKILDFDQTKNKIYVTGSDNVEVEVTSLPFIADVKTIFKIKFEHIEVPNAKSSSDLHFQLISEEGGVSRIGRITIKHNGYVNYKSEFLSVSPSTEFAYGKDNVADFAIWFNQSAQAVNVKNVPVTLAPAQGSFENEVAAVNAFKILTFTKAQSKVKVIFRMAYARYTCSNRGGSATARTQVTFDIWKNGSFYKTVHTGGVIDKYKTVSGTAEEFNVLKTATLSANAGDTFSFFGKVTGGKDTALDADMDGRIFFRDINWSFECSEQAL